MTDLGDFTDNFGSLLASNRGQIDRIVANLNAIVGEVKVKLPVLDSVLGGLDEAAKRLIASSRYGDWLNNNPYCGALFNPAQVESNGPCISGTGSLQNAQSQSQSQTQTQPAAQAQAAPEGHGAEVVTQLLAPSLRG